MKFARASLKFAKNAQSTFTIRGAPTGVPSWEFTTNTWETWSFDLQANWWRLFPSALSLARTGTIALSIVQRKSSHPTGRATASSGGERWVGLSYQDISQKSGINELRSQKLFIFIRFQQSLKFPLSFTSNAGASKATNANPRLPALPKVHKLHVWPRLKLLQNFSYLPLVHKIFDKPTINCFSQQ